MTARGPERPVGVSAIVVNYRGRELLGSCLDSLLRALAAVDERTELIVVDNGSRDGSLELLAERYVDASVVALPENAGFPAGVNAGLERAAGEWVLLLNNDATIEPDAVRHLLAAGRRSDDVGSVACQLRFTGTTVINSAGIGIDALGVVYDRLLGEPAAADGGEPVEVFGTSAGAAMYRRAMLDDVGGFDGSFFVYLEDADVAWRARMRGWRALYAPAAVAYHRYSATSGHASGFKYFHVGRNRVRLLAKNASVRQLARALPRILVYDAAYVVAVAAWDRTLAPLTGRLRGLREWRRYRRAGAGRRAVPLEPARGIRGALARRSTWTEHAERGPSLRQVTA